MSPKDIPPPCTSFPRRRESGVITSAPPLIGSESSPLNLCAGFWIKFLRAVALIIFSAAALLSRAPAAAQQNPAVSIIPKPDSIQIDDGVFTISPETLLIFDGAGSEDIAKHLADLIYNATGEKPGVANGTIRSVLKNVVLISTSADKAALGGESYMLKIDSSGISITSSSPAGAFYAVQTLRQLLPPAAEQPGASVVPHSIDIPALTITDFPRFPWRGLMIDTARHFQPKSEILKIIDIMAIYKMNRLHLHLTDDQGWRIEIKKYPDLTAIGSLRSKSKTADLFLGPTGPAHGGYYSQDDLREIIAYAQQRFITVVPEIEMPGHSQAALASVPGLACVDQRYKVLTHWGVNKEVYCAGNDKTLSFLEDVLSEVAALFPGEYIHVGGDEVPKDRWKQCPKCQARIKAEGLKNEEELQGWFMKRIETFLESKGKKLIGWDEIVEGGLPPRAAVMSWRGMDGGVLAARQGHDVVMSPTSNCYFDYRQAPGGEPEAEGGLTTLEIVYSFEPVPAVLDAASARHILGTQGNLWSEYISTPEHLEYMAFPRALALAEVAWTQQTSKNFNDFTQRLVSQFPRLDLLHVNYRKPEPGEPGYFEPVNK